MTASKREAGSGVAIALASLASVGVAGRRLLSVDLQCVPLSEQDLAGSESPGLADVCRTAEVDLDLASAPPGLRVPSGELGRPLENGSGEYVESVWIADDDMASRRTRHMQPEILGLGDAERQLVVVPIGLPDQDDEAHARDRPMTLPAARHRLGMLQ